MGSIEYLPAGSFKKRFSPSPQFIGPEVTRSYVPILRIIDVRVDLCEEAIYYVEYLVATVEIVIVQIDLKVLRLKVICGNLPTDELFE